MACPHARLVGALLPIDMWCVPDECPNLQFLGTGLDGTVVDGAVSIENSLAGYSGQCIPVELKAAFQSDSRVHVSVDTTPLVYNLMFAHLEGVPNPCVLVMMCAGLRHMGTFLAVSRASSLLSDTPLSGNMRMCFAANPPHQATACNSTYFDSRLLPAAKSVLEIQDEVAGALRSPPEGPLADVPISKSYLELMFRRRYTGNAKSQDTLGCESIAMFSLVVGCPIEMH